MDGQVGEWMDGQIKVLRVKVEVGTAMQKAGLGRGVLGGRLKCVLRPRREISQ